MIPWKLREGSLRALQGLAAEVSELIKIHEWENNQQLVTPFTALSVGKSIHGYLPPSRRCGQLLCLCLHLDKNIVTLFRCPIMI